MHTITFVHNAFMVDNYLPNSEVGDVFMYQNCLIVHCSPTDTITEIARINRNLFCSANQTGVLCRQSIPFESALLFPRLEKLINPFFGLIYFYIGRLGASNAFQFSIVLLLKTTPKTRTIARLAPKITFYCHSVISFQVSLWVYPIARAMAGRAGFGSFALGAP